MKLNQVVAAFVDGAWTTARVVGHVQFPIKKHVFGASHKSEGAIQAYYLWTAEGAHTCVLESSIFPDGIRIYGENQYTDYGVNDPRSASIPLENPQLIM